MKVGDIIIYDSGFGYDIGIFCDDKGITYNTVEVFLLTGVCQGRVSFSKRTIIPFTLSNYKRVTSTYHNRLRLKHLIPILRKRQADIILDAECERYDI